MIVEKTVFVKLSKGLLDIFLQKRYFNSHDTDFKTIVWKREMLVTSIFYFSNNVVDHIKEKLHRLGHNVVCKSFEFGQGLTFCPLVKGS